MKVIKRLTMLTALALSASASAHAANGSDLSDAQKQTVLRALDSTCGDVWCESDDDFEFNGLTCQLERGLCTVDIVRIVDRNQAERVDFSCNLEGVQGFSDLYDEAGMRVTRELQSAVGACIEDAQR